MSAKSALEASRPDLLGVDVEGGDELDVADVVAAEDDVHEAGHPVGRVGVLVVGEPLHQRAGAVAHAGDGEPDSGHVVFLRGLLGSGALGLDQAIEPGEVVGEVVGVVLEQGAEVGVGAAARRRRRRRSSRRPSSSVRRRSNSSRRAAGSRWRAKATRRVKARSSLTSGSASSSTRRSRPGVGDAVDLLAPAGALDQAALAHPGLEGGQLAGERAGHRRRRARRCAPRRP